MFLMCFSLAMVYRPRFSSSSQVWILCYELLSDCSRAFFNTFKGFVCSSGLRWHYLSGFYGYVTGFGRPGQGFRVLKAPAIVGSTCCGEANCQSGRKRDPSLRVILQTDISLTRTQSSKEWVSLYAIRIVANKSYRGIPRVEESVGNLKRFADPALCEHSRLYTTESETSN